MPYEYVLVQKVLAALLIGYLLGAVPFAHTAARLRGVDIFATGNRTAGAANVFWNIGRRTGTLVFVADLAKGSAAVIIAQLLEVPGSVVLLAGAAAIFGHWKSVFSGFRGGDGMSPLMGVTLALIPTLAPLGIVAGFTVILLLRRSVWRSSWGIAVCFAVILGLSLYNQTEQASALGLIGLAWLVLVRSNIARRRRSRVPEEEEIALDLELEQETELGPAAPDNL